MRLILNHILFVSLTIFVFVAGRSLLIPQPDTTRALSSDQLLLDKSEIVQLSSHLQTNPITPSTQNTFTSRPGLKGFGVRKVVDPTSLIHTLRTDNRSLSAFESNLKLYEKPEVLLRQAASFIKTSSSAPAALLHRIDGQTTLRLSQKGEVLPTSLDAVYFMKALRERPTLLTSMSQLEIWESLLHYANESVRKQLLAGTQRAFARPLNGHSLYQFELLKNYSRSEAQSFTQNYQPEWSWIFDGSTPEDKVLYFARILETRDILHRILQYRPSKFKGSSAPTLFQKLEGSNFGHTVDIEKIKTGHSSHWLITVKIKKDWIKNAPERLDEFQFQMDLAKNILDLRGQHFRSVRTDYFNPQFGLLSSAVSFMTSILAERKDKAHIGVIDSFKKQFEVENRKCTSQKPLVSCHYNEKIMVALANALNVFEYSTLINRPEVYVRGR